MWFNQPWRAEQFAIGTELVVTGLMMIRKGEFSFAVSEAEALEGSSKQADLSFGRLTPCYGLAQGLSQTLLRRLVADALSRCEPLPATIVPESIVAARGLMPLGEALRQVHFPSDDNALQLARGRVAYEELFGLQVAVAARRAVVSAQCPASVVNCEGLRDALVAALPFAPTGAQARVMADLQADLEAPARANRLIHGDVGSGKTVCAAFALAAAAQAGRQAVLMAPTELLAEQHFRTLHKLLQPLGIRPVLLTGGNPAARRRAVELAGGPAQVVVGTHALFQESVRFRDLAVVIIDEQHRFGVTQRARLAGKGQSPNLFVMSATPIPRTLALTAYGDFDVSVLDELPPGRQPVVTVLAWGSDRRIAYETLAAHVAQGRQGYVVCPLVDAGEDSGLAAAEKEFSRLSRGAYASVRMGLVHGRTEAAEREETMRSFSAGRLQVLVATTVIEVGVDVPNATVMIVENAERFGLAQLHQLRGRVARGEQRGKCILLTRAGNPEVIARLRVLERTNDGFAIAEEDLRRRGPGEMAGTRQSGLPDLRMADLVADTVTLAMAREDAFGLGDAERRGLLRAMKAAQKPEGWTL